ncbi:hypothetical protein JD844_012793 [Phrynosoma platyrhinos]|uniref:TASOR pseudo-PARP domain-containing protein n=1 Tax=Phrynosoma platyrhinos TaxID=52577 RepID=A0ABQ7TL71_PHRPL|nr:hypothetical protein JD844_012793 [Phrynosoma platyrhinos]
MADAEAMSGGEKTPEAPQRAEAAEEEDSFPQNGDRSERSRREEEEDEEEEEEEEEEEAAMEERGSPRNGHRKGGTSSLPKAPEDLPLKKNFQIPRKIREKKALFQPLAKESREFEDVVNILHSSYLEIHSKDNFIYKQASLIHNELFEKEFIEKRRELKRDGRSEKELAETYAFLKVDRELVQNICENGLQAGHSKITVLGSPSRGVYLSRYADLLQANPLEGKATGDIIIFKVIKGRTKTIYDNLAGNPVDSTIKSALDPTPKYECHISKNANRVTSVLNYRAFERTQYYFYEYGFDEIRQRPRHVCPYAVVSFSCKGEKVQNYLSQTRSKISNMDKSTDKTSYTLWNGQLLNRGTLVCHAALKSETRPLLPCKLPEKLDVDMVMSIEHLKQRVSTRVLQKETYSGEREEGGRSPDEHRGKKTSKRHHSAERERSRDLSSKKARLPISEGHKTKDLCPSESTPHSPSVSRPPSPLIAGTSSLVPRLPAREVSLKRSIPRFQERQVETDSGFKGEIREEIPVLLPQEISTHRDHCILGTEADDSEQEVETDRVLQAHPDLVMRRYLMPIDFYILPPYGSTAHWVRAQVHRAASSQPPTPPPHY